MKNPLPSVFFILLRQGKDNYAKIGTRLFPVTRHGIMVGQVRTVPESTVVIGDFQKLGRMVLTFVQVYFFSVYQGIGGLTGERLATVKQSGGALQNTHLVEQTGRYTAQAAASFE